ncbi:type 1 glutamine amidotransferase domain-containing protein [Halocola ammonii]
MSYDLSGKKIAILATDGFEQVEFTTPKQKLEEAGAEVHVISEESGEIKGWDSTNWGDSFKVDKTVDSVVASDYNGLMLPGGVINPDKLRRNEKAVEFTKSFFEDGKPIAAICHAPQLLIETDALNGREMTSFPSIKTDLKNAGARWVDKEVVVDEGLTTSRSPEDMEAFCNKMLEEFAEGVHEEQKTV